MRTFAILALLGLVSAAQVERHQYLSNRMYRANVAIANQSEDSDDSSDSSDSDEDVAVEGQIMFRPEDEGKAYPGDVGRKGYTREDRLPKRFSADSDDLFIRSMVMKYAVEEETEEDKKAKPPVKGGDPTGVFVMDEVAAKAAAYEVLNTHKNINGAAADTYLATYFPKAWSHFDVNRSGAIPVVRTPEFMRFLCSDQYMSLGQ